MGIIAFEQVSMDTQIPVLRGHPLSEVYTFPFDRIGVICKLVIFDGPLFHLPEAETASVDVHDVAIV